MKITCPDCSTSYDIKPNVVGAEGRSVKCARCGNRWFVSPPEQEDSPAPERVEDVPPVSEEEAADIDEAAWEEDAAEESEVEEEDDPPAADFGSVAQTQSAPVDGDTDDGEAEEVEKTIDIETMANRPKIKVNPNKFKRRRLRAIIAWFARLNYRRLAGIGVFLFSVFFVGAGIMLRDTIVKSAPDLASLYETIGLDVNLRGLEFRDLRTFQEVEEGKIVLVVEGSIRNVVAETTAVPAVHLSLRGEDHQEIYAWTVEPRTVNLDGLDETRFRTRLEDPPENAVDIQVRFVERKIRQTSFE